MPLLIRSLLVFLTVAVAGVVAFAASNEAPGAQAASVRVYVGEPVNGCGDGFCRGPSRLLYRPRSLKLFQDSTEQPFLQVRALRWSGWGARVAVGTGTARIGDPDNGYIAGKVRVMLRARVPAGCSDDAGRYHAYARATVYYAKSFGYARPSMHSTLGC